MNYITEYNNKLQSGEITASRRVKAVYARLAAAAADPSGKYVFDEQRASRPIAFIERFCKHSKGEWAAQRFTARRQSTHKPACCSMKPIT